MNDILYKLFKVYFNLDYAIENEDITFLKDKVKPLLKDAIESAGGSIEDDPGATKGNTDS